ncbi:C4-dicarboxylate TRAP transporter substrate-binding protein [Marispirochaeta sp.]|jgi:TRAP-type transport system periplasmic protein|uniref:C4-dicarboxylate TRAP transporter substrate-binding protein n=1 Tax=Marispirochaeta sp. TaxID=2038653 RepID=UPI0029C7FDC9|nr:C4-dicarboxylate TRAP transporter substrate-binding protein [Marispirochaeta sp.]
MKKIMVLAVTLCIIATVAFAGGQGQGSSGQYELKISHVLPTNEPIHEALVMMGERIIERTQGAVNVQVYPNSELGNNKDNLEQIRQGANIIAIADPGYMADYVPDYGIMNGPFLYPDYTWIAKLADTAWHSEMLEQSKERGFKILAMDWYFGGRHIISDEILRTPQDLSAKGMKVRVPPNKMWIETIKAMGGAPTTLQWSEVYSGLSQGVVDAAEAPLSTIYGSKLQESKKRIALTGHFRAIVGLIMSEKYFSSMPVDLQQIVQEEVDNAGVMATTMVAESESEWQKKLEAEGVTFNEVNIKAFQDACSSVYKQFPDWTPGLYDRIKTELGN